MEQKLYDQFLSLSAEDQAFVMAFIDYLLGTQLITKNF